MTTKNAMPSFELIEMETRRGSRYNHGTALAISTLADLDYERSGQESPVEGALLLSHVGEFESQKRPGRCE